MKTVRYIRLIAIGLAVVFAASTALANERRAAATFRAVQDNQPAFRQFMQTFPKGGDLHNHLVGAIYAETWLDWAAEDGLCVDLKELALKAPEASGCSGTNLTPAREVRSDDKKRRKLIDALSLRSFVPYAGHSGHNQFFDTFARMAAKPERFVDMLVAVSERAAAQNILYLELMHTMGLETVFAHAANLSLSGDPARDYATLMEGPFGTNLAPAIDLADGQITAAFERKNEIQKCGTPEASPGCAVEIRLLHQVIREAQPSVVYAQIIFGWHFIEKNSRIVGLNLVAPEDGYIALRDYRSHMAQIDYLYKNMGTRNITLHAGELTLGLVRPKNLRFHIRQAIDLGHAKRIGHGIDIAYEDKSAALLVQMAQQKIMVEINLTSNDIILGVKGADHPFHLYKKSGVPLALSTDDEGVSRIDLTHEYMRAARDLDLSYRDLKQLSENALTYSFLPTDRRQDLMSELARRFVAFEKKY